jgi:hypothetical protein
VEGGRWRVTVPLLSLSSQVRPSSPLPPSALNPPFAPPCPPQSDAATTVGSSQRLRPRVHRLLPHPPRSPPTRLPSLPFLTPRSPPLQSDAATTVGSSQRRWRVTGSDFESAAASLIHTLLAPAGFAPRRLVRVPYFCAGDRYSPVAVLDAALIVLEKAEEGTAHGAAAQGAALGARNGSAAAQGAGRPDGDEAASARRPAAGASPDGEGGAVVRGAGATRVGAEAPRRAVSSPRPSLLAPTPRPHRASFPLPDSTASSDHAHVDETRCDDCDALDGYRFGDK